MTVYLAEHDQRAGEVLVDKVLSALEQSDLVVALLTPAGHSSTFVQHEIAHARSKGKLVIPLVHTEVRGLDLGVLKGIEYIVLDPENPADALSHLAERVVGLARAQESDRATKASAEALERARAERDEFFAVLAVSVVLMVGAYVYFNSA